MVIKRNLKTPETRAFWADAERAAKRVATWPLWKLGQLTKKETDHMTNHYIPNDEPEPGHYCPNLSPKAETGHMSNISLAGMSKEERTMTNRNLGDYCPSSEVLAGETEVDIPHGHPGREPANSGEWDDAWAGRPLGTHSEDGDGPLTQRMPPVEIEVDTSALEEVSLFMGPLVVGGIYLLKRWGAGYLELQQDGVCRFKLANQEKWHTTVNGAREAITKRLTTDDILTAVNKSQ